ncbi:MAG: 6-phosphofructokinase [Xanthomonadales bacterium]|nr:6-phosphofructokinase [Xanthomonadales bacterium]
MGAGNLLYAQSGGPTAVINATAAGVLDAARKQRKTIGKVFAARNGILGALREQLYDLSAFDAARTRQLRTTPGSAFGSCRFKLKGIDESRAHYERLIAVCRAHDIRYFLYNGGNDSADTAHKISQIAEQLGYGLHAIGVPKTVDNDLVITDNCPGFGSAAKYTAISMLEASIDVEAMFDSSTKVFVLEVMGRHAGWLAAAAGLAGNSADEPPQIILFPEVPFDEARFLAAVKRSVERNGYCSIAVSEGVRYADGRLLAEAGTRDAFGHAQLGGAGELIAKLVRDRHGYKYHFAVPDYLQRAARHIASKTDDEQAYAVGVAAVQYAAAGMNAVMPIIRRVAQSPYRWKIEPAPLAKIANHEKMMPKNFIRADGYGITKACRNYLEPLIAGEACPPYARGIPSYLRVPRKFIKRKLAEYVVADK